MGIGGVSFWELLIIMIIVMVLFGTNRLRNLGADLGGAIKGFRSAMSEGEQEKNANDGKNDSNKS
jgi:sec-independent protein translocase protein TatA